MSTQRFTNEYAANRVKQALHDGADIERQRIVALIEAAFAVIPEGAVLHHPHNFKKALLRSVRPGSVPSE